MSANGPDPEPAVPPPTPSPLRSPTTDALFLADPYRRRSLRCTPITDALFLAHFRAHALLDGRGERRYCLLWEHFREGETRFSRLTPGVVLLIALGMFALPVPIAASAAPPSNVAIHVDLLQPTVADPWTATGAITDNGTAVFSRFFRSAIPSPVVGVSHADIVCPGAGAPTMTRCGDGMRRTSASRK